MIAILILLSLSLLLFLFFSLSFCVSLRLFVSLSSSPSPLSFGFSPLSFLSLCHLSFLLRTLSLFFAFLFHICFLLPSLSLARGRPAFWPANPCSTLPIVSGAFLFLSLSLSRAAQVPQSTSKASSARFAHFLSSWISHFFGLDHFGGNQKVWTLLLTNPLDRKCV